MRFWDASALVPLCVGQPESAVVKGPSASNSQFVRGCQDEVVQKAGQVLATEGVQGPKWKNYDRRSGERATCEAFTPYVQANCRRISASNSVQRTRVQPRGVTPPRRRRVLERRREVRPLKHFGAHCCDRNCHFYVLAGSRGRKGPAAVARRCNANTQDKPSALHWRGSYIKWQDKLALEIQHIQLSVRPHVLRPLPEAL